MTASGPVGVSSPAAAISKDRIYTIPNAISAARIAGVPVFLWLMLGPRADGWAFAVLALSGVSDWLDGKIARRFKMTSRLGSLLDPLADRLYIAATLAAFADRGIIPLWLVAAIVARDAVLLATLPVLRRHGYGPLPVHFVGKAATLLLLYAFPILLLAAGQGRLAEVARPPGWALLLWGTALYWWAAALYLVQLRQLLGADRMGGDRCGRW